MGRLLVLKHLDKLLLNLLSLSFRFYIFKRDEDTSVIRDVEVTLHKVQAPTSDDEQSLDGQITAYKQMCLLRYDITSGVSPGDSGAGIFYKRGSERLLLGLHKSTEEDEGYHSGIAIHAIFHAITGEAMNHTLQLHVTCHPILQFHCVVPETRQSCLLPNTVMYMHYNC